MSKLDEILSNNHGNSVFGESFDEERAKQQIKDLMLKVIGEDIVTWEDTTINATYVEAYNTILEDIRQKVSEL